MHLFVRLCSLSTDGLAHSVGVASLLFVSNPKSPISNSHRISQLSGAYLIKISYQKQE